MRPEDANSVNSIYSDYKGAWARRLYQTELYDIPAILKKAEEKNAVALVSVGRSEGKEIITGYAIYERSPRTHKLHLTDRKAGHHDALRAHQSEDAIRAALSHPGEDYSRPLAREDIPALLALDRQANTIPWTERQYGGLTPSRGCVGIHEGQIMWSFVYHVDREAMRLEHFAVPPEAAGTRHGVSQEEAARWMNGTVEDLLEKANRNHLVTIVDERNLAQQIIARDHGMPTTSKIVKGDGVDSIKFTSLFNPKLPNELRDLMQSPTHSNNRQ